MPSRYLSLHYHLVFSTKDRLRLTVVAKSPSSVSWWKSQAWMVFSRSGGIADHVHLLVDLKATHCLADFTRELKKASSARVHDKMGTHAFAWQEGYAAFTALQPELRMKATLETRKHIIKRRRFGRSS